MTAFFAHLSAFWLAVVVMAVFALAGFFLGRRKADRLIDAGGGVQLNSRANFHGYFTAMWTVLPMALVIIVYAALSDGLVHGLLKSDLPESFAAAEDTARAEFAVQYDTWETDRDAAEADGNEPPAEPVYNSPVDAYVERAAAYAELSNSDLAQTDDALFNAVVDRLIERRAMVKAFAFGLAIAVGALSLFLALRRLRLGFRARDKVENGVKTVLLLCAGVAIATTIGIVLSLIFEAFRFFSQVSPISFLTGTRWDAQANDTFGALPLFYGTFLISLIAMLVAVPIGLYSAIFLSEYATPRFRAWAKPILEVLAGIPTVVYGFFAVLLIAPLVRLTAMGLNDLLMLLPFVNGPVLDAQPFNALAAGLVMGVMIIPFVSSLSDDVINAVPQSLRDGAYAMGATRSETIKQVVLPAALPGVIAAILLAVSRAIGETMIVVMAAGQRAQITPDVTSDITTITAMIVALLTGDSEYGSTKVLSAFALGFVLFIVTLMFNLIALRVVAKYREKYD